MTIHLAALALAAVAAQQVSQPMIDWSPLIPAMNDVIKALATALAAVVIAAIGVGSLYAVTWLRSHGIKLSAETQAKLVDAADRFIQNAINFGTMKVTAGVDAEVNSLKIPVSNPLVASAANYIIAQVPGTFKKLGLDVSTPEGQAALVRMITARLIPTPPLPTASVDVNLTSSRSGETAITNALNAAQLKGSTP